MSPLFFGLSTCSLDYRGEDNKRLIWTEDIFGLYSRSIYWMETLGKLCNILLIIILIENEFIFCLHSTNKTILTKYNTDIQNNVYITRFSLYWF